MITQNIIADTRGQEHIMLSFMSFMGIRFSTFYDIILPRPPPVGYEIDDAQWVSELMGHEPIFLAYEMMLGISVNSDIHCDGERKQGNQATIDSHSCAIWFLGPSMCANNTSPESLQAVAIAKPHVDDWTRNLQSSQHAHFFRSVNWTQTPLGPLDEWGTTLQMYTNMVMSDTRAASLYWGPKHIAIYNEAFVPHAASRHPSLMGQPFAYGFPELVSVVVTMFEEAARLSMAQDVVEMPLMVQRNGYVEETFFTGNFNPIRGPEGNVEGIYNALFEVTQQKIRDRQTKVINRIATARGTRTVAEVYGHILNSLEDDPNDIPMAIIYEANCRSSSVEITLRLRGQLGVPHQHSLLRDGARLGFSDEIVSIYDRARSGTVHTVVDHKFNGVEWLGFEQPPKTVVTFALATSTRLFGFLTVGTNPCRPYDSTSEQFILDLTRTASSILASAWETENMKREHQQLQAKLEFSDMKLRHLVNSASIGMAHVNLEGQVLWANEHFLRSAEITTAKHGDYGFLYEIFVESDQQKVQQLLTDVLGNGSHSSAELRLKRCFTPQTGDPEPAHVQMLAFPYQEPSTAVSAMVCTTDISRLKWAEAWQAQLAESAREDKRQQEHFIDVVSHEMRNPLSAVSHSAEMIVAISKQMQSSTEATTTNNPGLLEDILSTASTILNCTQHQTRILDDVLTLGRLESTLLSVTPSAVKPSGLFEDVMALFNGELQSKDIKTTMIAKSSMDDLAIDQLYLDSSRVTQVVMNLLTNAIKFVSPQDTRRIAIRFGATLSNPGFVGNPPHPAILEVLSGEAHQPSMVLHWASIPKAPVNMTDTGWDSRGNVYLTFSISDTGIGMEDAEITKIFKRFEQASMKTYVTYGGSGLGLFISKQLIESMGGNIGVMSRAGHGSTFVFYVQTQRVLRQLVDIPIQTSSVSSRPLTMVSRRLQVLLVEDNIINQKVLSKQLNAFSCDITIANHGLEALQLLRQAEGHIDIVLMDIQMPVMDGLTCMTEIRKHEDLVVSKERLPIIAVTANVRQEQVDNAIAAGADDVVKKPFATKYLVAVMHRLVYGDQA